MIYSKSNALSSLKPNTQWAWIGTEYSGLTWLDSGTAPTEYEIDAELDEFLTDELNLCRNDNNLNFCIT